MTTSNPRPWWRLSFFVFMMLVIEFLDELPMTVTGKVIRKELKARSIQEGSS